MTYEQIVDTYPDLLRGLVRHEGIGFVLVHSESDGGLVIGSKGFSTWSTTTPLAATR